MNCPVCERTLQQAVLLDSSKERPDLRGFRCSAGHGVYLPSDLYFSWRETAATSSTEPPESDLNEDVGDIMQAKLCPQDSRIMTRYRVASEGGFWLDRCATCGGIWFDGAEWDATVAAGLHEQLPRVFSDSWQRAMIERSVEAFHARRRSEWIGHEDLQRVESFREWVWGHEHSALLLARVLERPEAASTKDETVTRDHDSA